MHKKRIAIIVPGGIGAGFYNQGLPALMNLVSGLSNHFQLTVYSLVKVNDSFTPVGFTIRCLQADHHRWMPWRMLKIAGMILQDHKKQPYELFHGIWGGPPGMLAVLLGKWLDRPALVSLQGGETAEVKAIGYGQLLRRASRKWLFRTLYAADHVTALTQLQVKALRKHKFKNDVTVIPFGVNTSLFSPVEKKFHTPFQFLHIANLTGVKDQETLLRAFRLIRDAIPCSLDIVGADYLSGKIQRLCAELRLTDDVSFSGPVKNTELPQFFAKAHVLLHTSLYEAQAVVVAEALACKVLVSGTKTGLIADLEKETVSVDPGDFEGLARQTLEILKDEQRYRSTVESGYQWARTHDIGYTVEAFSEIYNILT